MRRTDKRAMPVQEDEIAEFMTEFARFLIAAGISRTKFSRIIELAYFQAAAREGKFQNNRLNQSAVAAMTGLTRSQVRSLARRTPKSGSLVGDRVDRIVGMWTSDAEYLTAAFAPRRLRIVGSNPSFSALVRKVGGDIPYRAILRELLRLRLVIVDGVFVSLARGVLERPTSRALREISRSLARVLESAGGAEVIGMPINTVTLEVGYPALSAAGRILMQRRMAKSLKAFMADIEAAGAAVAMESPSKVRGGGKQRVSQARMLLLTREKTK